ncbi:hypothetical protein J6590_070996 [Homalodisca vitripennis]|nr:hypothetical protein J6590_070996 [Homalodisca vitripennis]
MSLLHNSTHATLFQKDKTRLGREKLRSRSEPQTHGGVQKDKNQVGKGEAQEPVKSLRLTAVFKCKDKNQVGKGEAQEPVKSLRLTAVFKCVRHD